MRSRMRTATDQLRQDTCLAVGKLLARKYFHVALEEYLTSTKTDVMIDPANIKGSVDLCLSITPDERYVHGSIPLVNAKPTV